MRLLNLTFFLLLNVYAGAQGVFDSSTVRSLGKDKPSLDSSAFENWPAVSKAALSKEGKYCGYVIDGVKDKERILIIKAIVGDWKIVSKINGEYFFLYDGRRVVWRNAHDSLCIATLGTSKVEFVPNVLFFDLNDRFLSYQLIGEKTEIRTINLEKKKLKTYSSASTVLISNKELSLGLINVTTSEDLIILYDKFFHPIKLLWKGSRVRSIVRKAGNDEVAFLSGILQDSLWYYRIGLDSIRPIAMPRDSNVRITGLSQFSKSGKYLFVNVVDIRSTETNQPSTAVDIWSFTDARLQSQQLYESDSDSRTYTGAIQLSDCSFTRLNRGEELLFFPKKEDSVFLIREQLRIIPKTEASWNANSEYCWYLLHFPSAVKMKLVDVMENSIVGLSPYGKYVIYYDSVQRDYFVYESGTGRRRNITRGIKERWDKDANSDSYGRFISGWEEDDRSVFLNGERDIWQIDPDGILPPINLTNYYGCRNNVIFSFALEEYSRRCIRHGESIILNAFNINSKENGFYRKESGKVGNPDSLSMGPYIYNLTDNFGVPEGASYPPIKALKAERYIVKRMSATEAPNYFATTDFSTFKAMSNVSPGRSYNWYTSELHHWKSPDQRVLSGILYKPENFDSLKKYPIIFYYYEKRSDGLNAYLKPRRLEGGCALSISYYVSNGYLIFSPDIYYKLGDPMQGTFDAVVSAASYIGKLPYVNTARMGIQGCSWGGVQTNYLVTHSGLFAAACSASGLSNWVSSYNSIMGSGECMQGMYEIGQFRMGATLWQNPKGYIKNSAIFQVDKVTTPLLLMHTRNDGIYPMSNVLEFFNAFHQLRKPAWMLLYEGNHGLFGRDEMDFSLKMKQFFDHYLQGLPAPKWMTKSEF